MDAGQGEEGIREKHDWKQGPVVQSDSQASFCPAGSSQNGMVARRQLRTAAPPGAHTISGKRPNLMGSASCHPSEGLAPSWVPQSLLTKPCHFFPSLYLHLKQTCSSDRKLGG